MSSILTNITAKVRNAQTHLKDKLFVYEDKDWLTCYPF